MMVLLWVVIVAAVGALCLALYRWTSRRIGEGERLRPGPFPGGTQLRYANPAEREALGDK